MPRPISTALNAWMLITAPARRPSSFRSKCTHEPSPMGHAEDVHLGEARPPCPCRSSPARMCAMMRFARVRHRGSTPRRVTGGPQLVSRFASRVGCTSATSRRACPRTKPKVSIPNSQQAPRDRARGGPGRGLPGAGALQGLAAVGREPLDRPARSACPGRGR